LRHAQYLSEHHLWQDRINAGNLEYNKKGLLDGSHQSVELSVVPEVEVAYCNTVAVGAVDVGGTSCVAEEQEREEGMLEVVVGTEAAADTRVEAEAAVAVEKQEHSLRAYAARNITSDECNWLPR
jgi:hypothetical protein